jgi:hypothetical protein
LAHAYRLAVSGCLIFIWSLVCEGLRARETSDVGHGVEAVRIDDGREKWQKSKRARRP